ncbi:hypothetical protein C7R94_02550 [Brevibacillus sp. NRRL NRS-603]|nr:hypothetical protein [Brevibacillus formosus]PSK20972.1 hypothetical protein C7R94_02550 [Brevibacillus sp. NRRL NRS-603]
MDMISNQPLIMIMIIIILVNSGMCLLFFDYQLNLAAQKMFRETKIFDSQDHFSLTGSFA